MPAEYYPRRGYGGGYYREQRSGGYYPDGGLTTARLPRLAMLKGVAPFIVRVAFVTNPKFRGYAYSGYLPGCSASAGVTS